MIILTLRTDKPEAEIGLYDDDTQLIYQTWQAHRQLAETIHQKIRGILSSQNLALGQVEGIVVYEGPGSFTGLRIGLSVANAFGYSESIPVVATGTDKWAQAGIKRLQKGDSDHPAQPMYGALANVTKPKK